MDMLTVGNSFFISLFEKVTKSESNVNNLFNLSFVYKVGSSFGNKKVNCYAFNIIHIHLSYFIRRKIIVN